MVPFVSLLRVRSALIPSLLPPPTTPVCNVSLLNFAHRAPPATRFSSHFPPRLTPTPPENSSCATFGVLRSTTPTRPFPTGLSSASSFLPNGRYTVTQTMVHRRFPPGSKSGHPPPLSTPKTGTVVGAARPATVVRVLPRPQPRLWEPKASNNSTRRYWCAKGDQNRTRTRTLLLALPRLPLSLPCGTSTRSYGRATRAGCTSTWSSHAAATPIWTGKSSSLPGSTSWRVSGYGNAGFSCAISMQCVVSLVAVVVEFLGVREQARCYARAQRCPCG